MYKYFFTTLALFFTTTAFSFVDMKNANYADSWIDYQSNGTGFKLRVQRTYNSRSTYDGLFGFGWCSDFETRIEIMPDNSLKVIECGGGLEVSYVSGKELKGAELKAHINKLIQMSKEINPRINKNYVKRLEKDLAENQYFREALAQRLGIKGKIENNSTFISRGRGGEKITYSNGSYIRSHSDGTFQKFDSEGKLVAFYDKSSNFIKLVYTENKLTQVVDNNGKRLEFKYDKKNNKVSHILTPEGVKINYTYRGQDLVKTQNAWKQTHSYSYDKLHNMTAVVFPDKTAKKIKYDEDKDLVMSFEDRAGCVETYTYTGSKEDSRNHYWSEVKKVCNKKVTNKSKYEFWHREKSDGTGKYLFRVRSENNGDITDITYHDIFGKPLIVKENKRTTWYSYNKKGMVVIKKTPIEKITYEYDPVCNKVSGTVVEQFRDLANKDKATYRGKSKYVYDKNKCYLSYAINTDGTKVRVGYDRYGRINKLVDQSQKYVKIHYDEAMGRPSIIERPGLGKIKMIYNDKGEMAEVKSSKGDEVALQVATVFNSLLEVVAPATDQLSI